MGLSNLFVNMTKAYQQSPPELVPRKLSQPLAWVESSLFGEVITVGKLLSSIQPVPSDSVLLGQCSDGLPFLLELVDPDVGAILIGCDAGCGKTHQLQVMVDSARRVKSPQQLKISILTHDPREWVYLQQDNQQINYVEGIHAWYDVQAEQLIQKITDLAEARRDGQQGGTMFLFIMDDINFVENLSIRRRLIYAGCWNMGLSRTYGWWERSTLVMYRDIDTGLILFVPGSLAKCSQKTMLKH